MRAKEKQIYWGRAALLILFPATVVVRSEQVFPNFSGCMLDRATEEKRGGRHERIKNLADV